MSTPSNHEVAVVGDGPAGSALANQLAARGVDVVLIGRDDPWTATYGTWADDIEAIDWLAETPLWMRRFDTIEVDVGGKRTIDRPYGVVDNGLMRAALRTGVTHDVASVSGVDAVGSTISDAHGTRVSARLVIDASGWPGVTATPTESVPRQTALGVVLAEPPNGALGSPMLMDFSTPAGNDESVAAPTFAYALPVADGWLVEETVLAAHPPISPERLAGRLAARLDMSESELRDQSVRVEHVDIPMGARIPDRDTPVLSFGAAAGMIHSATGYSLAASLSGAGVFAEAIDRELSGPAIDHDALWDALWPASARRTRLLHDYGLDVLLDLENESIRDFFSVFFDLDTDEWAAYLRITTPPRVLASTMAKMFVAAPWRLRRRLVSQNPLAFARLLRP